MYVFGVQVEGEHLKDAEPMPALGEREKEREKNRRQSLLSSHHKSPRSSSLSTASRCRSSSVHAAPASLHLIVAVIYRSTVHAAPPWPMLLLWSPEPSTRLLRSLEASMLLLSLEHVTAPRLLQYYFSEWLPMELNGLKFHQAPLEKSMCRNSQSLELLSWIHYTQFYQIDWTTISLSKKQEKENHCL
ncbi:hypothetical protein LWI29_000652 [Acer saccharum]|uniref:Uncharacterized protein n=1 Tax=Acer saccharum TaxID=4024 RepID=A0AA39RYE1_ACESA|nr:hypothetical protein LWI29_000652 [Acer saccharum]